MAKKTETRVVTTPKNQELEKLPDWVLQDDAGQEGGSLDDLVLPRMGICQSMSPQRKKTDSSFIEDLEEGQLFNTLTGEILDQPLRVTPLMLRHSKILWNDPEKIGSGIKCLGLPGEGGKIECQLNGGGPCKYPGFGKASCNLFMNFPLVTHKDPASPVILSLKSGTIKVGKAWYTQLKLWKRDGKPVPWYAQQFDITTVLQKYTKGEAYVPKITRVPGFAPDSIGRYAAQAFKELHEAERRGQRITAQPDTDDDDTTGADEM